MNNYKRIAVLSDIHGNQQALKAVLTDINNSSIDSIICLGDIATLGPSPKQCIKLIKDLNCPCVLGNHELALFYPEKSGEYGIIGEMLEDTIKWCLSKINEEDLSFLKTFSSTLSIPIIEEFTMLCYHGSPKSTTDSILSDTPLEKLYSLINFDKNLKIAIGGHTHFQMYKKIKNTLLINTGSVGCAFMTPSSTPPAPTFMPIAEYVIIQVDSDSISVELKSISFDFNKFKEEIINSDIPLKEWWLQEFSKIESKSN